MSKDTQPIRIGTSGWHYAHWKKTFYPESLAEEEWLPYYAERFGAVEINNSFYKLPEETTLAHWRDSVPDDFLFAVKASRYITHMKKLRDPDASTEALFERIGVLDGKLGPVLFQLPPRWKRNAKRLEAFLAALPGTGRFAFEFRDPSWFHEDSYELLRRFGAAFCIYELDGRTSPCETTADFVYLRLHGPGGAYRGLYGSERLSPWHEKISSWSQDGRTVYCFFDNDEAGYAVRDARTLLSL